MKWASYSLSSAGNVEIKDFLELESPGTQRLFYVGSLSVVFG